MVLFYRIWSNPINSFALVLVLRLIYKPLTPSPPFSWLRANCWYQSVWSSSRGTSSKICLNFRLRPAQKSAELIISKKTDLYLQKIKKFPEKANFARPRSRDPDIAARPYCARLKERKTKTIRICHTPLHDARKQRKSQIPTFSLFAKDANPLLIGT